MDVIAHSSAFLLPEPPADDGSSPTYALVILNQRLPRFITTLWNHGNSTICICLIFWFVCLTVRVSFGKAARFRVCADGGANRLFDDLPLLFPDQDALAVRKRFVPDVIKGDMDSVREDVLGFYRNMGTEIVDASDDQDTTDLHKCIIYIRDLPSLNNQNLCVLVAGALGGRFDHEMGNVNMLYRFPNMQIILLSEECLLKLLPSDKRHEIRIQSAVEGPHCGLIPFGGPSKRNATTGLQWNLVDTEMIFGGLISTSNTVIGEIVTVESDSNLLWTISLRKEW